MKHILAILSILYSCTPCSAQDRISTEQLADAARNIPEPVWQCGCSTNNGETKFIPLNADISNKEDVCHDYEGKYYKIGENRRRGTVDRLAAYLVCEPVVSNKSYQPPVAADPTANIEQLREWVNSINNSSAAQLNLLQQNLQGLTDKVNEIGKRRSSSGGTTTIIHETAPAPVYTPPPKPKYGPQSDGWGGPSHD